MNNHHGSNLEGNLFTQAKAGDSQLSLADRKIALLQSISDKKAKLKYDTMLAERREQVSDAIDDIVRLGYSYENVLKESGINAQFLRDAFESTGRTVPLTEDMVMDAPEDTHTKRPKQSDLKPLNDIDKVNLIRKHTTRPITRSWKKQKVTEARPEWLSNLVIDVTSSGDDSEHDQLSRKPLIPASNRPSPEYQVVNVNSEVSRISMRLKIEISRLTQRLRAAQDLPIGEDLLTCLQDKKRTMHDDITRLFEEIAAKSRH
ncbi:uncharacterized protein LALA0_S05e09340g [Lachancea lanzarotensis]|uniref:LALA0S05e09340g1_1 n=1 Tax=Lachancea lanzarotensis TaxID=1245769 RepID=A0A0C7MY31_9SACH|nr:uncharacterized protein LALA0_S05e09340g [Lachancea lanzarotensis]CEP62604.1 LALA0S05e09340g1_1 [Lachancea lanzarotensis]